MKLLKQGVCLALLGAGLAAAPATVASQASATPAPSSQASSPSLVQQIRGTARGQVAISTQRATGQVGFAHAAAGGDLLPGVEGSSRAAAAAKADQYLASYGGAFGAGKGQLTRTGITADSAGGWTASYSQSYKDVPVFGALLKAHVSEAGALTSVNGFAAPDINLSTTPSLSKAGAAGRAVALVKTSPAMASNGGTVKAKDLQVASSQLMVYRTGVTKGVSGDNHLAWVSEVRDGHAVRESVITDAQTGKLLNRWSMLDNDLDRRLYETNYDPASPATNLKWSEGDPFPGALNVDQQDEVVTSGESYWFFEDTFNRDSYDGNGATRITVNNDPTIACPNANWNGITTNYCTGVSSDDVVAHEWGHAYTEYTSGLIYQWQSGALNESYSDVWGETLDLINNRDDEGEGDLDNKRPVGVCSLYTRVAVELFVTTPAAIGHCPAAPANFGPTITAAGITDDVVVAQDPADPTGPSPTDGCEPFTNAAAVNGNFAYVDRGTCAFTVKLANAVNAGATGIIFGNNSAGALVQVAGVASIPGLMITQAKGAEIKAAVGTVTATMRATDTTPKADSYRWLVSEKATAFGGAIRDMWEPTCYGDPGKVSDVQYVCDTADQGGVHSNSGVPNHAYALLVDGGTYNNTPVTGIGLTKAAHIWYQAQTNYLTPVSNFSDMADAIESSCADLVGKQLTALRFGPNEHDTYDKKITAGDCTQVHQAAVATQMRTEPVQCDFGPLLDPNTAAPCGAGTGLHTTFSEDFEGNVSSWDTSAFDVKYPGGIHQPWTFSRDLPPGNLPAGDTRAAFGPAPDKGVCNGAAGDFSSVDYLTSPAITVGGAGDIADTGRLSFDHSVETEIGFDGGLVQVSKDNGTTWIDVPASAYDFNGPTVLATTAAGSTNPLQGKDGFTGTDGGKTQSDWGTSIIDLSDPALAVANGSTIKVRFAIGRDGCGGVIGWYVDNVKVGACKTLAPATVAAAHQPEPSAYGSASAVGVTVSGGSGTPTGSVTVKEGATTVGTATLDGTGKASVALPASLAAGSHSLSVVYSGDSNYDTKTQAVTATVNKATSTTTASAPKKVTAKKKFDVTASVAAAGGAPTGTVQVFDGSKLMGTGTLSNGTVTITITKGLKKTGKHTLTVKYLGSTNVAASQATVKVKVKEKKKH